jgi:hypothetical protein
MMMEPPPARRIAFFTERNTPSRWMLSAEDFIFAPLKLFASAVSPSSLG